MSPQKYKSGNYGRKTAENRRHVWAVRSKCFSTAPYASEFSQRDTTRWHTKNRHFILDDVLELFMHSNKLGGTSCGLVYTSLSLHPRAARSGIIEQCDTCLIVFLHNATDPMECVCAHVCDCVCVKNLSCSYWDALYSQVTSCHMLVGKHVSNTTNSNRETIYKENFVHASRSDTDTLTPVGEDVQTGPDWMIQACLPSLLLRSTVTLPHPVPVLKQLVTGLLPPPRLSEGIRISITVCAPVHQQLRRNHCFRLNPVQGIPFFSSPSRELKNRWSKNILRQKNDEMIPTFL